MEKISEEQQKDSTWVRVPEAAQESALHSARAQETPWGVEQVIRMDEGAVSPRSKETEPGQAPPDAE